MSSLTYHNYESLGKWVNEHLYYSQTVRVGKDIIEASGQGGWDPTKKDSIEISTDLATEYEQAFANVDLALRTAGGKGWDQVYKVRSYHIVQPGQVGIPSEVMTMMTNGYRKWMPNHQPIWTMVGVAALGLPEMRVEIEVIAYDPQS